jgi:NAD(P)-dependent dehydrogenase (short-subunit alcohol dehydrogenase family)
MLEGRKVAVIGGSSGIGLATADALVRAGAEVAITGRDAGKVAQAAAALGGRVTGHILDGRHVGAVTAFFAHFGSLDHLVVALGGGSAIGPFAQLDEATMRAGFDNKFFPYLNVVRAGASQLSRSGSITLVTGAAARRAMRGMSGLAAVNGALHAMIGPLALEYAPIRVNAVSPGLIDTPYWDRVPAEARRAMYDRSAASVPVGRVGTPEDIARAILFLAASSFTTGAILDCDGGARLV